LTVHLSRNDQHMLDGHFGPGCQMAMRIVVRLAEACGVTELMDVTQAHIDGCGLLSESSLLFAETLAGKGARVSIPTTLSMGPLDLQNWRKFNIDPSFAQKAIRQGRAYESMGCIPTWTCAPYQSYLTPRFGQQIAWGESNAVVYANSVLGARTNRYADFHDICAAITGRVPKCGLHLQENRKGQILFQLTNIPIEAMHGDDFYSALGYLIGTRTLNQIPVIVGMSAGVTGDNLKALGAAGASSGSVMLFHAVGITPEAATLNQACHGDKPRQVIEVTLQDIQRARNELSTAANAEHLDAVILGCPHFSFDEFGQLAECIRASRAEHIAPGTRFIVKTSRTSYSLIEHHEMLDLFKRFGIEITLDTCVFHTPLLGPETKVIMTNSGKCAYYAPGELGVKVAFGSMQQCVDSAVRGCV
jgi:predicted aconitase